MSAPQFITKSGLWLTGVARLVIIHGGKDAEILWKQPLKPFAESLWSWQRFTNRAHHVIRVQIIQMYIHCILNCMATLWTHWWAISLALEIGTRWTLFSQSSNIFNCYSCNIYLLAPTSPSLMSHMSRYLIGIYYWQTFLREIFKN